MNNTLQKLEAILFTEGSAVAKKHLMKLMECNSGQLENFLDELCETRKESGVVVVDSGTQVALATNPSLERFMESVKKEDQTAPLSKAAQETLSIVAYAGPIAKVDLDFLRGVNTQYTLRRLAMRGLIAHEQQGRLRTVAVTPDFLLHLGIQKTENLPEYTGIRQVILEGLRSVKKRTQEKEL